jgi:hypothetical protein
MSVYLVSTRFNNETWEQNLNYRKIHNIKCIYGTPLEFPPHVCIDSNVFVVEMNNTKNKIEGIGLVKNRPYLDKYYKIYNDGNYNRYIYKGNYHLTREELSLLNDNLVQIFDYILFKEKTHLKRGSGFTTISEKLINRHSMCDNMNMIRILKNIFVEYFT